VQKYLIIQLLKLTTQKCNINGVKLKLDFDPRKNISAFAYFTSKINSKQKYFYASSICLVIK